MISGFPPIRLNTSLLFVVPNTHVKKLQSIHNSLARIVTQTPRYTVCPITKSYIYPSITKIVLDLHWLLVWSHLYLKINLLTYKAVKFQQPPSFWNLLEIRDIPHGLRSTRPISLFRPFARGFGTRANANYASQGVKCTSNLLRKY